MSLLTLGEDNSFFGKPFCYTNVVSGNEYSFGVTTDLFTFKGDQFRGDESLSE